MENHFRRAKSYVSTAAGVSEETARSTLERCGFTVKTAIVMLKKGLDAGQAAQLLSENGGVIARALGEG